VQVRINKYLSDCGIDSRRKVERLIIEGRVSVNDKVVTDLSTKINSSEDRVSVDGQPIDLKQPVYYLLNKPKATITSTQDEKGRKTVLDLIKNNKNIFPVGRLDYNTTGVLLLTNDGDFAYLLTHPKHKVPREYEVKLDKALNYDDKKNLTSGIMLDQRKSKFESIIVPQKKNASLVKVMCYEGRNHFVKRMFANLGYSVKNLVRISYAGVYADIPTGTYRKLSTAEVKNITKHYAT
jgi:23S rRNA pseudouridine2605 synthase